MAQARLKARTIASGFGQQLGPGAEPQFLPMRKLTKYGIPALQMAVSLIIVLCQAAHITVMHAVNAPVWFCTTFILDNDQRKIQSAMRFNEQIPHAGDCIANVASPIIGSLLC